MRLTIVILLCFVCLNAELFKNVVPSASKKETECYVILTLNDKERTVFKSVVDKYDKFVYRGLYEKMVEAGSNETYIQLSAVVASSGEDQPITVRSAPKLYSGLNYGRAAFTTLTAVIKMDHGVVESISWDDGCHRCLSSSCGDNTVVRRDGALTLIRKDDAEYGAYAGENCYTSASTCEKTQGTCDFQLFVVWSGTDSRGQVLQSTNLRISRFQKGSIESIMNEL